MTSIEAPRTRLIPLDKIDPCPTNPRKVFKRIEELAEDLKQRGLLQAIIVRAKGARFEIVMGERRFRACKVAGFSDIAATVRDMSDADVLETQIVENSQREDVDAFEEAEGYERLHTVYKYDVDTIALKVGRSRSHVYQRMRLLQLCPMGRKLVQDGKLQASIALYVARIPSPKLQEEALREIVSKHGDPMTARHASGFVQQRYMLRLADAQFPVGDVDLVPKAGGCADCPKRSGNQRELFPDLSKKDTDLCTDPKCFKDKSDAQWKRIIAGAVELGRLVLTDAESRKVFGSYGHVVHEAGYIDLDEACMRDQPRMRKYRDLLPSDFGPVIFARDMRGKHHELVEDGVEFRRAIARYLPEDKHGKTPTVDKKAREEKKLRRAAAVEAIDRCTLVLQSKAGVGPRRWLGFWRVLALEMVNTTFAEVYGTLCAHLELAPKKGEEAAALRRYVQGLKSLEELYTFVLCAMGARGASSFSTAQAPVPELCAVFGIDWRKVLSDTKKSTKEKGQRS
ncbi:MAG: ParB/RepB/Spo0J family partition protein [Solirubrobacterales bacterium]